jgi:hypothetical protein
MMVDQNNTAGKFTHEGNGSHQPTREAARILMTNFKEKVFEPLMK